MFRVRENRQVAQPETWLIELRGGRQGGRRPPAPPGA